MEVIKKAPTFAPREISCRCQAVLKIDFSDLQRREHRDDGQGRSWTEIFVTCPECGHENELRNNVPTHLIPKIPEVR